MKISIVHLLLLTSLFSCAHSETKTKAETKESGNAFNPLSSVIQFYRGPLNHLSAVRRGECPMHPSCSEYSRQCALKHGAFIGWMMTCDRLIRCGRDEMKLSPTIFVNGKWRYYDPVKGNDFWQDKAGSGVPKLHFGK